MSDQAARLVQIYYDTPRGGTATFDPERLGGILATDLAFEGPIAGSVTGAEYFISGVSAFVETMTGMTMLHRVASGDEVAALYDAELPGGTVRFAELFRFEGDRIRSLRLLYDAGDYTAKGGR